MPVQLLAIGTPILLKANVVYALPPTKVVIYCEGAPSIFQSNTFEFTTSKTINFAEGVGFSSARFIQPAVSDHFVVLKRPGVK